MRLLKVSFRNYKVLEDRVFEFQKNPFYYTAPNETGKSTLIEGIKDAFSLAPERLKPKTTLGKSLPPVLEVTFGIENELFTLKVNAQDETVTLKGSDGTDLSRPKAIESFLSARGYHFFPSVLGGLLVLKERDPSVETTKGLKGLIDRVLKCASIEELKKAFEGMLIFQKGWGQRFRQQSFGKQEKILKEELESLDRELAQKLARFEEHQRNKERLSAVKKTLAEKRAFQDKLVQKIAFGQKLILYAEYQAKKVKISKIAAEIDDLQEKLASIKEEIARLEEERKRLEEERAKSARLEEKLKALEYQIKERERELLRLSSLKERYQKLEKLSEALGPFREKDLSSLEQDFLDWQTYLRLCQRARGAVKVIEAEDKVFVNGKGLLPGESTEFEGEAQVAYQGLKLHLFSSLSLAYEREKIEQFKETYGSLKRLESLRKLKQEHEKLAAELKDISLKDLEGALSEQKELLAQEKQEIEALKTKKKEKESILFRLKEVEAELARKRALAHEFSRKEGRLKGVQETLAQELLRLESAVEDLTLKEIRALEAQAGEDLARLEAELKEKEKTLLRLEEEIRRLEREESELKGLTKFEPDPEEIEKILARKKECAERLARLLRVADLLHHGLVVLRNLGEEINREYLKRFEIKVNEYFSAITHGAYVRVKFGARSLFFDGETFKNCWQVERRDGKIFVVEELSDGTASQLLLAARLALIRLFFERKAFLLLDEPFAYFDHQRTQKTRDIFETLAREGWQVIVLSAKA